VVIDPICQHIIIIILIIIIIIINLIIILIKDGRKQGRKNTHKKLRLSLPGNCIVCIMNVAGTLHTAINHTVNGILHALTGHIKELLIRALETQMTFSSR
jgi:hypothetical protein